MSNVPRACFSSQIIDKLPQTLTIIPLVWRELVLPILLLLSDRKTVWRSHFKTNLRMKNLFRTIATTLILGFISIASFAQDGHKVTVIVEGIVNAEGTISANLTNDEANFPGAPSAVGSQKVEITEKGTVKLIFENVPSGAYAVVIVHDLNGNDKLDMNGQMPAEPFGFSKLAFLMGPPQFKDCAFEVNEDTETIVSLISY